MEISAIVYGSNISVAYTRQLLQILQQNMVEIIEKIFCIIKGNFCQSLRSKYICRSCKIAASNSAVEYGEKLY